MKEKKIIKSLAVQPRVWSKFAELADANNFSMSSYFEVLILEQWRNWKSPDVTTAEPTTILANGKPYK